jgi:hypothetical protein
VSERDETLRRAAATTRAKVLHEIDIDDELSVTLERAASRLASDRAAELHHDRRRVTLTLVAAATVAFAVAGIGLLNSRTDSIETRGPVSQTNTRPGTGTAATTSSPPSTTATTTTTTTTTTTLLASTTTTTPVSPAVVPSGMPAGVSYLSPPSPLSLRSLGSVPVPPITDGAFDVAIGDLGIAVSTWLYHAESGTGDPLTVIGFDGSQRSIDLGGDFGSTLAFGPGDVLYAFSSGDNPLEDFAVVTIALDGDRAGSIVASTEVSAVQYMELPRASFGHGRDGVVDRVRDVNKAVIGYVDVNGKPVEWDGPEPPLLTTIESDGPEQPLSTTITQLPADGSTERSWQLTIDASTSRASSYVGPSPAAPTNDGLNVYWTHIGPNARPDIDFGEPTMWVIAALYPDGRVQWWSLPNGWEVVASDVWGTVVGKTTGNQLELAVADFNPSPAPPP